MREFKSYEDLKESLVRYSKHWHSTISWVAEWRDPNNEDVKYLVSPVPGERVYKVVPRYRDYRGDWFSNYADIYYIPEE